MDTIRLTEGPMSTLHSLEERFETAMKSFEDRFTTASTTTTLNQLAKEFQTFKEFVKDTLTLLRAQISNIASVTEDLENRSRRKFLLFKGVKEDTGEDTSQIICDLGSSRLRQVVESKDIAFSYRLGKVVSPDKPRPILVKLRCSDLRMKLWRSKTLLKGSGVSVAEFLTATRRQLFTEGRRLYGLSNCWSQDAKIYIKLPNGSKLCLQSMTQLKDLAVVHPPSQPETQNKKFRSARLGKKQ